MLGGDNNNSLLPFVDENLFQYPSNTSNQLQLFANVNYSGREIRPSKRPREPEANLMQKKLQISLNHNIYHEDSERPSSIPNPHHVSTGLKLSYDDEEHNSSITSASASMTVAPSIMSSFGDIMINELDRHKQEFERYIMLQEENMLKAIRDIRQRHTASFLAAIERGIDKKIREKDMEIDTINRKNKELVERIKQVANEAQNWHYRAKYNESVVNVLKTNLQQAMAHGNENQAEEGFGDTDLEHDVVSSVGPKYNGVMCRSCRAKEVSVLVMPCRHLSLCKECDALVGVCPVCHVAKTVSVEVYMS